MENKRAIGPVIGLVIILALIIIGSIYFWHSRKTNPDYTNYNTTEQDSTSTDAIKSQSSSDDINSIDADLQSYNDSSIDGADSGL